MLRGRTTLIAAVIGSAALWALFHLPGMAAVVERSEVDLTRHGDDLAVTVAAYRRLLTLPPALARHSVTGARVVDGELQVRFEETTA